MLGQPASMQLNRYSRATNYSVIVVAEEVLLPMSSPAVHSVHFYHHDDALVSRLHNIVTSSLESGNSVLIVATEEHRALLQAALKDSPNHVQNSAGSRLQMFDAREMLQKFMINHHPSDRRFAQTVGKIIDEVRITAKKQERSLTVFGEMVALLWSDGNKVGALELERIWNDALRRCGFHLHCAYPRWILEDNQDNLMIKAICDEHSSVLGHGFQLRSSPAIA